jgi:molecular chaperone GrpE (heat shock protein)
MDDLVERLRTAVNYGYMPRRMREVANEAASRITELEAEVARLREAADRSAKIVEQYLYRQSEKVADVPAVLRAALAQGEG